MSFTPIPPTINGLRGSYKQPGSWGRSDTGYFWVYSFEGTKEEVENDAGAFSGYGAQFEVEELRGGRARLTARVAWPFDGTIGLLEVPEEIWELDPQEEQKDALSADFPNGTLNDISKVNKVLLKKYLETIPEENLVDAETGDFTPPAFYGDGSEDKSVSLFMLMRAGVRSFPVEASTIRHTKVVSNRYSVKASFLNVNRIISSSSMISLEGVPSELLFDVPTTPTPSQIIEDAGDLQYGWRKTRPRVTKLNFTRWQITTVWQLGLWAVKMWGSVL